ncbi:MAG: nucleoside transporter C-terminal domain-containing protein [Alphaproteobacteria bacterium]|nr:nucleoside transporter C-terminal domain-containing protein [Alphaproteobacteria bacterium]
MENLQSAIGLAAFPAIAWLFCEDRSALGLRRIARLAAAGIALQLAIALILLKVPVFQDVFLILNGIVDALQTATRAGTSFVFGYLGGGTLPFEEPYPGAAFVLGLQALPLILVVSALSALLFHWRILPWIVRGFAFALKRTMGTSGALGLSAAANIFVGMVEAPLLVRPYLARMSRSDLFCTMTVGMATIAGTVMVLYAQFLQNVVDNAIGHILTASLISAPAAILIARLMVPSMLDETQADEAALEPPDYGTSMGAITRGTADGVNLLIHVIAMLLVLVALVELANLILSLLPDLAGEPITLQRLAAWLFWPLAWLMGISGDDLATAGTLLGIKTVLNELLAYLQMAQLPAESMSQRSALILVYALCGFANFGSLGIMIGGLTTLAPERRDEIVALGLRTILSGTLATCMTGAVVGLITF